jgi:intergrase/recombinase
LSEDWLYQVRIKVQKEIAEAIRFNYVNEIAEKIVTIAKKHKTSLVCTLDAFTGYVKEAEKNGIDDYPLYSWTKRTIENKEKVKKHSEAFAFYYKEEQVYSRKIAEKLHNDLLVLYDVGEIKELRLIDTNPDNNPQPPPQK